MITGSQSFVFVFAVLIHKVSPQDTVEGVIGSSVVLPCLSTKHDHKPEDIEVSWRHNGSKIVFDIVNGEESLEEQEKWYKNRTQSFHDKYQNGNFSIILDNLQHTDAGEFSCFITHSSELQKLQLNINEPTGEIENHGKEKEPDTVENSLYPALISITVLICIILIACLIIIYWKRRTQADSFSSVSTETK